MSDYQRILLLAPPAMSHSPAFDRATELALSCGAALHILAFDYVPTLDVATLFDQKAMTQAREGYLELHRRWLHQETDHLRGRGLDVSCNIFWCQHPLQSIVEYIRDLNIDLLIKDVHLEPGLKRLFATPLDWQLLRDSPVPVHLVAGHSQPLPRHVLVAVDLGGEQAEERFNDRLVQAGQAFARQCAATFSLVHVHDKSRSYIHEMGWGTLPMAEGLEMASRANEQQGFKALAERNGVEKNQRHFLTGPVIEALGSFVEHNAVDVLVMGTRHSHGLDSILGSTAENILYRSACSLLALRPARLV
ncbi:universal stress protein [Pseudomonas sp. FEN]|uniref:universal stress protein n=1 Tax=Pseudomonas sp. FEN TaxID=2767468 RepID=UPI001749423A|nr:universal stress protein [Pseudomonas sp. FEN]CAD5199874.1 Universal stress protein family 5 [Pseudomonas sp. FEN]